MTATLRRTTRSLLTLIVGIVALGVLSGATPAHAWVSGGTAGRPGAVYLNRVEALDLYIGSYPNTHQQLTFLSNGPTVYRSPSTTGAQDLTITYSIQHWDGYKWVQVTQQLSRSRIAAGYQAVRMPNLYVMPVVARGYFRVVEFIQWYSNGTLVAAHVILPSTTADHACITQSRPCASYAGFLRVGRLLAVGGGW
jgi:hypothetical protein